MFGLNIISIMIILQIDFGLIPLFESKLSVERIQRVNNLFSNCGQGILISTFFYLLVVYFPERLRAHTVRKLIQPRLDSIVNMMQLSIAYIIFKYKINTSSADFSRLTFDDFKNIQRLDDGLMNFKYRLKAGVNWSGNSSGQLRELLHFQNERNQVINKIDKILALPIIQSEEDILIESLAKLRDCWFYSGVDSFVTTNLTVTVSDFNKGVYDYYLIYLTLSKFANSYNIEIVRE